MIRNSPCWMILVDERILEYLEENSSSTPNLILSNTQISEPEEFIRYRFKILHRCGFVNKLSDRFYYLSVTGHQYLRGELSEPFDQVSDLDDAVAFQPPIDYELYMQTKTEAPQYIRNFLIRNTVDPLIKDGVPLDEMKIVDPGLV